MKNIIIVAFLLFMFSHTGFAAFNATFYSGGNTTSSNYLFSFILVDYGGNTTSSNYNFYVNPLFEGGIAVSGDVNSPTITIHNPAQSVFSLANTTMNVNYTVTDNVAVDSCWYIVNSSSIVIIQNCANFSYTFNYGFTNLTLFVNDSSGNIGSSQSNFTIQVPPVGSPPSSVPPSPSAVPRDIFEVSPQVMLFTNKTGVFSVKLRVTNFIEHRINMSFMIDSDAVQIKQYIITNDWCVVFNDGDVPSFTYKDFDVKCTIPSIQFDGIKFGVPYKTIVYTIYQNMTKETSLVIYFINPPQGASYFDIYENAAGIYDYVKLFLNTPVIVFGSKPTICSFSGCRPSYGVQLSSVPITFDVVGNGFKIDIIAVKHVIMLLMAICAILLYYYDHKKKALIPFAVLVLLFFV